VDPVALAENAAAPVEVLVAAVNVAQGRAVLVDRADRADRAANGRSDRSGRNERRAA